MPAKIEKVAYVAIILIIVSGAYLAQFHHDFFRYTFIG